MTRGAGIRLLFRRVPSCGGLCFLSTPPRIRFLLRRDPHLGMRGLALLPEWAQMVAVRAIRGSELAQHREYRTHHFFWHVRQIEGPSTPEGRLMGTLPPDAGWAWKLIAIRKGNDLRIREESAR